MANLIPREFIDELLTRIDLVELIDARVPLRKRGINYQANCPFHTEKTPSFSVNSEKQFYYCFGCKASGNAISFLIEHDGLDFLEAVETLADLAGMPIPKTQPTTDTNAAPITEDIYACLQQAALFYQQRLRKHPAAIDYLKQRGLSGQIAKQFGIGFAPPGWDNLLHQFGKTAALQAELFKAGLLIKKDNSEQYYDRFRNRIIFPIRDRRGRVIGFGGRVLDDATPKYLNSPETPAFHKGQELYGLYEARRSLGKLPRVVIVEGYMDVIALFQHGINYAVATLGTATSSTHVQRLLRLTDEVIFCFDGDNAGKTAAERALEITLPLIADNKSARFLFLPGGEDPDTLIRREGTAAFSARLQSAMPLTDFFFENLLAQGEIHSLEGRAHFARRATEFFTKMPDTFLKTLLQNELSRRTGMDEQQLQRFTHTAVIPAESTPKNLPALTPVRLAVALLLQSPQLMDLKKIDEQSLQNISDPGIPVLCDMIQIVKSHPQASTGSLLEHWRGSPYEKTLNNLAVWEHPIPVAGIAQEWQGILQRLYKIAHEQQIQQLFNKAKTAAMTDVDRQKLQELLRERG